MIKRDLELVQGDDYAAADSRAHIFTGAGQNWPDLSAATFSLKVKAAGSETVIFSASGTRSVVSGVQSISVPMTAAQTLQLPEGTNAAEFDLQATISGRRLTLAQGMITVLGGAT